jgi:mRNA-degrading endonuclease RelE of RelBE toxin-antitoxin system
LTALRYLPGIRDQLHLLPPATRTKVKASLEGLARGDAGLDVRKLRGDFRKPLERLKVGSWRVVFYRDGAQIYVIRVFPRMQGYDWLAVWET